MPINKKIVKKLKDGTKAERKYICGKDPLYFALLYFPEFFDTRKENAFPIAPFHYDMYKDMQGLVAGDIKEVAWIMFRESAKTSLAKIFLIWMICYNKKKYINYDSYDKSNAESALFDVAVWLQTKERIINDFGQLYFSNRTKKKSKIKRLNNFVTENDVKVEAFSTQEPTRGRIFQDKRPDAFVLDDIENSKTKDSQAIIKKIKGHIDEMRTGLGPKGFVLYLGNLIAEEGVISHTIESLKSSDNGKVRQIPVEKNSNPTWPGKYVMTNKDLKGSPDKISLEQKKEDLGKRLYEMEMMNNPTSSEDYIFNREVLENQPISEPEKNIAGFKIWKEFKASHRYAIGGDSSEGIGRDANASVVIDFSPNPAEVVATFSNNKISPTVFAHEMKRHGEYYGESLLVPEVNQTGYAVIGELNDVYKKGKLYKRQVKDKLKNTTQKKNGWKPTSKTVPDVIYSLADIIEDGKLVVHDKDLVEEMKQFKLSNIKEITTSNKEGLTRHFDKLRACMLAWEGNRQARPSKSKKKYKQKPYKPISRYEGRRSSR